MLTWRRRIQSRRCFLRHSAVVGRTVEAGACPAQFPPPPDLANLFSQIAAYSQTLKQRGSSLEAHRTDVNQSRREAYHPEPAPLKAERVSRTEKPGYLLEKVVFSSTPFNRVPSYLFHSAGGRRRRRSARRTSPSSMPK